MVYNLRSTTKKQRRSSVQTSELALSRIDDSLPSVRNCQPIETLPDDVLLEIFHLCTPLHSGAWFDVITKENNILDMRNAPWSVSHVCQRWRNVCLSSQLLWCYVGVGLGEMVWMGSPFAERYRLKLHLERSGNQPLFVSLYDDRFWRGTEDDNRNRDLHIRRLLGILEGTMWRWKGLRVDIDITATRVYLPGPFDHLEYLFLGTIAHASRFSFNGFCRSPRLRCLAFSEAELANELRIPWSQVTDYGGFSLPIGFGMSLDNLRKMANLQRLDISSVSLRDPPARAAHFPFLNSLTVPLYEPDGHARLSEFIDAPALTHLIIRAAVAVPSLYLKDLFDPIFRFLTRLEIYRANFSATATTLLQFLRGTPKVEYLRVSSRLCIEFFDGLKLSDCSSSINSDLLPALRVLDISEVEYAVQLDSSVLNMLESRCRSSQVQTLEELHTCTGFLAAGERSGCARWQKICEVVRFVYVGDIRRSGGVSLDEDDDNDAEDDGDYDAEGDSDYDSELDYTSDSGTTSSHEGYFTNYVEQDY